MKYYLFTALLAYFLGSLSPSVWLGRYVYKRDLRKYGSNNPGASNATYVFGYLGGVIVLVLDVLKGFFAVMLADWLCTSHVNDVRLLLFIASLFAVVGHCNSVFLKFTGGKGFATFIGVYLYQFPQMIIFLILIFGVVVLITKYISIGTFTLITTFPLLQLWLNMHNHILSTWAIVVMFTVSIFIAYKHRINIVKLMTGKEISIRTPRVSKEELKM